LHAKQLDYLLQWLGKYKFFLRKEEVLGQISMRLQICLRSGGVRPQSPPGKVTKEKGDGFNFSSKLNPSPFFAALEVIVETRGRPHVREIMAALNTAGFRASLLDADNSTRATDI
jgi:hypothetical protein